MPHFDIYGARIETKLTTETVLHFLLYHVNHSDGRHAALFLLKFWGGFLGEGIFRSCLTAAAERRDFSGQ